MTDEKLRQIEQAEDAVRALGFRVFRVRHHDAHGPPREWRGARWPAPSSPTINERLVAALKALGYQYVSLDLQGYRLGSLNEALRLRPVS